MRAALRAVFAVVVAMALALALVMGVELYSALVHPLPQGFRGTIEEMCKHVARYPHWVPGTVVILWSATAYASVRVAARIGGRVASIATVLLLALALSWNIAMLPYALWFKVVMLGAFAIASFFGVKPSGATLTDRSVA